MTRSTSITRLALNNQGVLGFGVVAGAQLTSKLIYLVQSQRLGLNRSFAILLPVVPMLLPLCSILRSEPIEVFQLIMIGLKRFLSRVTVLASHFEAQSLALDELFLRHFEARDPAAQRALFLDQVFRFETILLFSSRGHTLLVVSRGSQAGITNRDRTVSRNQAIAHLDCVNRLLELPFLCGFLAIGFFNYQQIDL